MSCVIPESYPDFLKCVVGVLTHKALYGIPDADGKVVLREDDDGCNPYTLREVCISNLPSNTCVLSAHYLRNGAIETDGNRSDIWKGVGNYRHVSDYIIIAEVDGHVTFLYVEMKTGFKKQSYIPQLRCAHGQISHLLYLIEHFDTDVFPSENVNHRFVKFTKLPVIKGVTHSDERCEFALPPRPTCNDDPRQAYQYFVKDAEIVDFRSLIL